MRRSNLRPPPDRLGRSYNLTGWPENGVVVKRVKFGVSSPSRFHPGPNYDEVSGSWILDQDGSLKPQRLRIYQSLLRICSNFA